MTVEECEGAEALPPCEELLGLAADEYDRLGTAMEKRAFLALVADWVLGAAIQLGRGESITREAS